MAKSFVDDALAKVSELGTIGAMKWLERQLAAPLSAEQIQHAFAVRYEAPDPDDSDAVRYYRAQLQAFADGADYASLAQKAVPQDVSVTHYGNMVAPQDVGEAMATQWTEEDFRETSPQESGAQEGFWDVYEPNRRAIYATVFTSAQACNYARMGYRVVEQAAAPPAPVAPCWQRLTAPGQVKVGDTVRFDLGGEQKTHRVALVLEAGTEREEIIYHKRNNWYLITAMAIANSGSQKNVEFRRRA